MTIVGTGNVVVNCGIHDAAVGTVALAEVMVNATAARVVATLVV
jgi:hypothetical protein